MKNYELRFDSLFLAQWTGAAKLMKSLSPRQGTLRSLSSLRLRVFCVIPCIAACAAFAEEKSAAELWDVFGSFGRAQGQAVRDGDVWRLKGEGYVLETTVETDASGVSYRRSTLRNVSDRPVTAYCLMDRIPVDEGELEVYTQSSFWQNESRGRWQPLVTSVVARNPNMRSCNAVAPMLAVWNRQAGRGRVFHLMSDAAYEMSAIRSNPFGDRTRVSVEVGMDARQLAYELKPGESVAFPEVIAYEFSNRLDLDCHKLHAWWNRRHPGRAPASIYNTWLCRFDKISVPLLLGQVEKAAALGLDYFVIDAGWFGPKASWGSVRGDWEERPDGWLGGRMGEVSAAARKAGLKFGFWVEAESVVETSRTKKDHPDWVLPGGFYDFTNPAAFAALADKVTALLKKYEASFLKFDFNQNLDRDPSGRAFAAYNGAYRAFVREIRRRNPGIYIEGCASGGYLMDLGWARDFDSFWLSDNQSPRDGLRIVKETMLRLPPRCIDRWITARSLEKVQPDYTGKDLRLLAADDATWTFVRSFDPSYFDAFTDGGPIGFSCDLTAFSPEHLAHFRRSVDEHRRLGEFWRTAVWRILCDSPNVTVFQSSDEQLREVHVLAFSECPSQESVRVHPVLAAGTDYMLDGRRRSAAELLRDGLAVPVGRWNAREVVLKADK